MLLNQLARQYTYNKPDTALVFAEQALAIAKKSAFLKGEAINLNTLGTMFLQIGNYPKSLQLYTEALRKAEGLKDNSLIGRILSNIGTVYSSEGNYRKAVEYTLRGLAIGQSLSEKFIIGRCLANIGDNYEKLNLLDSALPYANQAYILSKELKDDDLTGISLNNLGNIHSKLGQDVIAMSYYSSCLPLYLSEDDDDGLCEAYLGMAKLFRKAGNTDSALYYAKLSLQYGKSGGFTVRIMDASNFVTNYYISIHNIDSAFVYQRATIEAKDSLFSQEKQREFQSLAFDETMREQQAALAKEEAAEQRSHNIQFALLAIAIISFIIIFLLLSQTVIVNEKWIRFLGVLALLLVFEFANLVLHPYIAAIAHDSPLYTLLIMVGIASLLIPLHHKVEHWITEKMIVKNKRIRIEAAKKTLAKFEKEEN